MFQVTRSADNRLDIEFSGKLDKKDMIAALDELISKAQGIVHGKILYRIGDFDFPTLGAIRVELSRTPELFRFARKFVRAAVIADKGWVRKASEIEGALIPGLEVKAFNVDENEKAEAWLESSA